MSTYRAYQVTGQRQFELVERELHEPSAGHVRFRVESCGVCHSDFIAVDGARPDPSQPVIPGHEVVGVIDAVGEGVIGWKTGDRVGVGFLGGHCGECDWCRRGDFVNCVNQPRPGAAANGGYAEVAYARSTALVRIPDSLTSVNASPLLCAGLTTYNAVRNLNGEPDALVAIQGIGGLGHLGLQYANKLGYRVAAIARGTDKASSGQEAWRAPLHRQCSSRPREGAAGTRRSDRDRGYRRERRVHVTADSRTRSARSAGDRRRGGRPDRGQRVGPHL